MKFQELFFTTLLFFFALEVNAGGNLLTKECDYKSIPNVFIEGHSWIDFPTYKNRDAWNNVPNQLKSIVIKEGELAASKEPVQLTGYDYILFKQGQTIDLVSQKILDKKSRLEDLILAELVEGKGRFIDEISNSVWDLCALGSWTGPEAQYLQTGKLGLPSRDDVVVDELTGEIAGVLSWAYYFFEQEFNKIDPQINQWIVTEVQSRFLNPNQEKYNLYWMCYQTPKVQYQTAWITYNWLLSELMIEKDNEKRQKSVYKALECLDQFYKSMPQDGAFNGGPEIWQYSVGKYFQSLELLDLASLGEIDIFDDELLRKMGDYICYTYINNEYNFNYAECSPNLILPAGLIYRYGKRVGSEMMKGYGSYLSQKITERGSITYSDLFNKIKYVIDFNEINNYGAKEPLVADMYLENSQIVVARSEEGSTDGFFFGVKGGNNDEFGNQNDAGNFVLYANGKPLIVDPGRTSKTSKSIGNDRYNVWSNQSAWHNLPTINGYMQAQGGNFQVVEMQESASDNKVVVSMNLMYAYNLAAEINNWTRTYTFERKSGLEITDVFDLKNIKGDTYVSFIAFSKPEIKKPGLIIFSVDGKKYEFEYKSSIFNVEIEEVKSNDNSFMSDWGSSLYRIVLKPTSASHSGNWTYRFAKA